MANILILEPPAGAARLLELAVSSLGHDVIVAHACPLAALERAEVVLVGPAFVGSTRVQSSGGTARFLRFGDPGLPFPFRLYELERALGHALR